MQMQHAVRQAANFCRRYLDDVSCLWMALPTIPTIMMMPLSSNSPPIDPPPCHVVMSMP